MLFLFVLLSSIFNSKKFCTKLFFIVFFLRLEIFSLKNKRFKSKFSNIPAQKRSILEGVIEIAHVPAGVNVVASDCLNPFQTFLCQLFAVLAIDLQQKTRYSSANKYN